MSVQKLYVVSDLMANPGYTVIRMPSIHLKDRAIANFSKVDDRTRNATIMALDPPPILVFKYIRLSRSARTWVYLLHYTQSSYL